ncbi:YfhO family protein [candidate division CSSED10-310 bacterium]|uniref:YfhO family protein n=1 Tax=candidate division CSSED10-310 bacterium TaxID=2855610 RepID=A0ABV6Z0D0_UNCC1
MEHPAQLVRELIITSVIIITLSFIFYYPGFMPDHTIIDGNLMKIYSPWKSLYNREFYADKDGMRISDPVVMFYPWFFYIKKCVSAGKIPLWNPYSYCGSPLLANYQSGFFYPLNYFFIFGDYDSALQFKLMVQFLICGLGMFSLLRFLKLDFEPALLGSIIFLFNGFSVCWLQFPIMSIVSLLPALILCCELMLQRWRPAVFLILILIFHFGITAGHPETFIHLLLIASIYIGVRLFHYGRQGSRLIPFFSLALVIAALGAGAQLLPFIEYLQDSFRLTRRIIASEASYIFQTKFLLLFYLPDLFGNQHARYVESSSYIGILTLILATVALRFREKLNLMLSFLVIALVCLAIPFGLLGVHKGVQLIPLLKISLNHRLLFGFNFGVSVLAAFGFNALALSSRKIKVLKRFRLARDTLMIVVIAVVHLLICLVLVQQYGETAFLKKTFSSRAYDAQIIRLLSCWFSGLLMLITLDYVSRAKIKVVLKMILPLLIFAELMNIYQHINVVFPTQSLFPETKSLGYLRRNTSPDRFTARGNIVNPNLALLYDLYDIRGYDGMGDKNYCTLFTLFGSKEVRRPYLWHIQAHKHKDLLDLLSVRFILTDHPLPDWQNQDNPYGKIVSETNLGEIWLYERTEYFPRVTFYHQIKQAKDTDSVENFILKSEFRDYALLSNPLDEKNLKFNTILPQSDRPDHQILKFEEFGNSLGIRFYSRDPAFLLTNNTYHHGWKAFIDGEQRVVYRTNMAFQGVHVPAGEHSLQLSFAPWSFRLGLFLSLMGVLFFMIMASYSFSCKIPPKDNMVSDDLVQISREE